MEPGILCKAAIRLDSQSIGIEVAFALALVGAARLGRLLQCHGSGRSTLRL